jgi:hypothetical protein
MIFDRKKEPVKPTVDKDKDRNWDDDREPETFGDEPAVRDPKEQGDMTRYEV